MIIDIPDYFTLYVIVINTLFLDIYSLSSLFLVPEGKCVKESMLCMLYIGFSICIHHKECLRNDTNLIFFIAFMLVFTHISLSVYTFIV